MEPLAICAGPVVHHGGQVVHGATTGLPPFPLPGSTSFELVQLEVVCPAEGGTFEAVATRSPSSDLGGRYKTVDGDNIELATIGSRELEIISPDDPDLLVTRDLEIAGALVVNCRAPATEPPEATATAKGPDTLPPTGGRGSVDGEDGEGGVDGTLEAENGGGGLGSGAIIALAVAAAAVGLMAIGWYYRSRRAA
jgi:hypothetical protein